MTMSKNDKTIGNQSCLRDGYIVASSDVWSKSDHDVLLGSQMDSLQNQETGAGKKRVKNKNSQNVSNGNWEEENRFSYHLQIPSDVLVILINKTLSNTKLNQLRLHEVSSTICWPGAALKVIIHLVRAVVVR